MALPGLCVAGSPYAARAPLHDERMLSSRVTVILMSRNEESRIDLAIRNYLGLFPIVASDNHSTDRTRDILNAYGVRVHLHDGPRQESRELVEHFYSIADTPYIIMGLAGEFMPLPLLQKFAEIAETDAYDIVLNTRRNITQGVSYFGWWREVGSTLRFFKRGSLNLDELRIHQLFKPVVPNHRVLRMGVEPELCIYQLREYDTVRTTQVNLDYGVQEADQRFKDGTSYTAWEAVKRIILLHAYFIFRGGWRRGRLGFRELWSGTVLITIIYWRGSDLRHHMTREDCARANRAYRIELLRRFNGMEEA